MALREEGREEADAIEQDYAAIRERNKEKYGRLIQKDRNHYDNWIREIESAETYDKKFSYNPKISVLVPVYNVLDKHLIPCIESVLSQIYTNWELCIADDCSTWDNVRVTLRKYEDDPRIKIAYRESNGNISECTNTALAMATGEYVAFLDCDDVLRSNALYEMVARLNEDPGLDFIYSDEDKICEDGGLRHTPFFKPDWSPDTLMSMMYTCHLSLYRRSIAVALGGLRAGYEGAQDYDFVLRFTEQTQKIAHIAKVLYHWRERQESTSGNIDAKPYVLEQAKKVKEDAVRRRGQKAEIEYVDQIRQLRVNYICEDEPKVSIIIPSKNNYTVLRRCISTLTELTGYKNYEIILVDNGSNLKNRILYKKLTKEYEINYIYRKMAFNFSQICNIGAGYAAGEYLLFLNDDMEIIKGDWLERMLGQAALSHTGAVGAKLLYPGSVRIQHVGVVSLKDGPGHILIGYDDTENHYLGRNLLDYNYSAVTAACLMINALKFKQAGGFDEELQVAYNDVEFCFRLVEKGYFNIVRNDAILYHHESYSRGYDACDEKKRARQEREKALLYEKHPEFWRHDPFYNVNLTQSGIDFSLNESKAIRYHAVTPVQESYHKSDSVTGCLDDVWKGEYIRIEGWIADMADRDNNAARRRILLECGIRAYEAETEVVYRRDVGDAYPEHPDLDFCGFRCMIDIKDLKPGVYTISMLWNDVKLDTGQKLSIV